MEDKYIVRPSNEVEPLDLEFNWEIYECPQCGGDGEIYDHYDGSSVFCEECNGTGELALYERESDAVS